MANPENVLKNRIKKGEVRNKKGRPKKLMTILKKEGLKPIQITQLILEMLGMTVENLKNIYENKDSSAYEKLLSKTIANAIKHGDCSQVFSLMLNRALGQPKQHIEQTEQLNSDDIDFSKMSKEDRDKFIELSRKYQKKSE